MFRDDPELYCLFVLWIDSHELGTMMAVEGLIVHLRGHVPYVIIVSLWLDASTENVDYLESIE